MWTTLESYGRRLLRALPELMPYILVAIGLLVVLILARLFVVLWSKKRVSSPSEAGDDGSGPAGAPGTAAEDDLSGIASSFQEAMRRLRQLMRKRGYHFDWFVRLTGSRYRYELPWFAVLGEEDSGKTTLLDGLGLEMPVSPLRAAEEGDDGGCNWWFFNQALVLDVPGKYLYRPDGQASEEAWTRILHQLRSYRSRQPLNGIVLTIPCPDLAGDAALSTAEIESKTAQIYNRLRDLQQELGLRLPVYVVLTKCDTVPGFQAFCEELPDDRADDMLGWSNPYAVDAAYASDWVDEAFESLYDDLHHAQIRALGDDVQTDDQDAFFLFPDLLREVKGRLSTYLDELFTRTAYHEGFMLRGIYFTGDWPADTAAAPEAPRPEEGSSHRAAPRPAFLTDLFRTKVFEEWKLARPVEAALSWQQWATRAVQGGVVALSLLGVFGLWAAADTLSDQYQSLVPTLQDARDKIQQVNQWQATAGTGGGGGAGGAASGTKRGPGQRLAFKSMATSLLRETGTAASVDLTSVLLPASWVSSVESSIDRAIATTYDKVILRSMRSALQLRADSLTSGGLRSGRQAAAAADTLTVGAMPSYQAWRSYVQDVSRLETAAGRYNGLTTRPNLDHFGRLAEYLFDVRIQPSLNRAPDVYRRAIGAIQTDSLRIGRYRAPATKKMRAYARQFNRALPQRYGVLARLRTLATQIDRLGTVSAGDNLSGRREQDELRSVRRGIAEVEAVLESPESRWITSDTLALEAVYQPFLSFADTSSLMGAGLTDDLRSNGRTAVGRMQARLASLQSDMTGSLLQQQDGQVRRALTTDVVDLRKALGKLLDQPFMEAPQNPQDLRTTVPSGRQLRWNLRELRQMVKHIQVYDSVTTKGFQQFPPTLQRTARQVAGAGLSDHLRAHLGRAQSFALDVSGGAVTRREAQVQQRADHFREALTPLNTVLTIQGELNMDTAQQQLARVTAQEAYALLQAVDNILVAENLYGVGESALDQWQGRRSPNLAAVNARDTQAVRRYLKTQRERMRFLAEDLAGPALSFLANWEAQIQTADRPLVAKWQGIRRVLRQYQNQTAGNALSVFENFLLSGMSGVRPVPYFLNTPSEVRQQQSSNYFLQKRNALRRALYARSRTLAIRRAREGYQGLASRFNQQLGGHFPFAALDDAPQPAPPEAVRRFYRQFARYDSTYRPVLKKADAGQQARAFLEEVRAIRPVFGAFLDRPSDYPIPTVDVVPTFRVNRDQERLGDQVIGWRIRAGAEQATYAQNDTLKWASGDPVTVRLRWARDAPSRPVAAEQGRVDPQARTVTYHYGGPWALLKLLRAHDAPPGSFQRRVDPDPHTLRYTARTREQADSLQASVFIRLHLYRPDEPARIVLPDEFPRRAPDFGGGSPDTITGRP